MKTLDEVLLSLEFKDEAAYYNADIESIIQKEMPGYKVIEQDMDENDAIVTLGEGLEAYIKGKFVEDIQTGVFHTTRQDLYVLIIAYKVKEG